MRRLSTFLYLFFLCSFLTGGIAAEREPVDYVNTRIGNISHLLVPTFPTTHLPHSMLRMIPGHHEFVTDRMSGLPLNVPSHRQGDVLILMPYCGEKEGMSPSIQYRYDHEVSTPYRYSVWFDDYGVTAEFAPQEKAAIFSFTYEEPGGRYIMLRTAGTGELQVNGNTLSGYENCRGAKHYFYMEFDQTPTESGKLENGNGSVVYVGFGEKVPCVRARYGISYIDTEQARKNLNKEVKGFDLAPLIKNARAAWNKALGKIRVEGGTEDERITFYTALYRCHERMIRISEDGRYFSGFDGKVHDDEGVTFMTDDWAWDTYRALHPLQILLDGKMSSDMLTSFIRMYEQSGWVPTFPSVSGDLHCMNGNHAASIFADALCKGIDFDVKKAFEGMSHTVMTESMIPWYRGPKTALDDFYHENGWFPALHPDEKETFPQVSDFEKREAVAVSLAASYDDWCISRMAKALSRQQDFTFFYDRSYNYRKLFNRETGFFHPKDSAGNFIEPFDYIFSGGIGSRAYYDENNAWTYIWDVPHNIADLIDLFGSREAFTKKLDTLFTVGLQRSKWEYYAVQPDATGNVGQFVMGNEPSFHIPYLYNYAGEPWKTQKRIRMLMESWFRNDLMGICGDEDGGGMSAFYVFSAMGFYPVTPGFPSYNIGSPIFSKVTFTLDNGRVFTVIAKGASKENKYIRSARLNGKEHNRPWFTHDDLMKGGVLELTMGNRPNKSWGVSPDAVPPSEGVR